MGPELGVTTLGLQQWPSKLGLKLGLEALDSRLDCYLLPPNPSSAGVLHCREGEHELGGSTVGMQA